MNRSDLEVMQSWSLDKKIQVTQLRIMEFYMHFGGNVYISFSGGKDSTVLLDLARRIYPDIIGVFSDTGLEYPEIKDFVHSKKNIITVRPKMSFKQVIDAYGYPVGSKIVSRMISDCQNPTDKNKNTVNLYLTGYKSDGTKGSSSFILPKRWRNLVGSKFKISHKCCDVMKKQPLKEFEKKTKMKPLIATMCCESRARKEGWFKTGCNSFKSSRPKSLPMSFWTENDVLEYLYRFNIPYCSVYGDIIKNDGNYVTTGEKRTGCMFCMFGVHLEKYPNRFQRMKNTHPILYEYCINKLGCGEILDFIKVPY